MLALIDADDPHHRALRVLFEDNPSRWILPWAVLPEIDYLLASHVGQKAEETFVADLAAGLFQVDWGAAPDLGRAKQLCQKYRGLRLGLVDSVVMAMAERLRAEAIATFDLRHFGAVQLRSRPRLFPRDA